MIIVYLGTVGAVNLERFTATGAEDDHRNDKIDVTSVRSSTLLAWLWITDNVYDCVKRISLLRSVKLFRACVSSVLESPDREINEIRRV